MKNPLKSIAEFFGAAAHTALRYPLTVLMLAGGVAVLWVQIVTESGDMIYAKLLFSLLTGAGLGMAARAVDRRWAHQRIVKMLATPGALVIAAVFFAFSLPISDYAPQIILPAACIIFAAEVVFVWIPTLGVPMAFHRVFIAHLKAVLTAALYSAVLSAGLSVIIFSVNALLVPVDSKAYLLCLSFIWVFFAPLSYLSFLPADATEIREDVTEEDALRLRHSKVAGVLISYILLPLLSVFTVILILYALKTFALGEWAISVLEPLFLICAAVGGVLFLIARSMAGRIERIFCAVFPKTLLFLSVFQLISLFFTFSAQGLNEGRYFIILLSLFSFVFSLLFSFFSPKRNSLIAPVAIFFALFAVIPPVDAFTLPRNYHIGVLESTLVKNNMLEEGLVKANLNISAEDKQTIVDSAGYLIDRGYAAHAGFLPAGFDSYDDIEPLFGFSAYRYGEGPEPVRYINFYARKNVVLSIWGYDVQLSAAVYNGAKAASTNFTVGGVPYRLWLQENGTSVIFHILRTDTGVSTSLDLYETMLNYMEPFKNAESVEPVSLETTGEAGRMRAVVYEFYAAVENGVLRNVNMNVQIYFGAL